MPDESRRNFNIKDIYHTAGSTATLLAYTTGYPSFAKFITGFVRQQATNPAGTPPSIPAEVYGKVSVYMLLIGFPIFAIFAIWLAVSFTKIVSDIFTYLGISCHHLPGAHSKVSLLIVLTITLPLVLGAHFLFLERFFGDKPSGIGIIMTCCSMIITTIYFCFWYKDWRYRSLY